MLTTILKITNVCNIKLCHSPKDAIMQKILVKVKNEAGLRILRDLDEANVIRLIKANEVAEPKLSSRLRGAISKETTKKMQVELDLMRNEWQQRNSI